jgi:hypothetical protein
MLNFILSFFGLLASVFLISLSIRYGLRFASVWDGYIASRRRGNGRAYNWYYRIPWSAGVIPEYFFFLVTGPKNYFSTNWWALRTGAYITALLFIALLFRNSMAGDYYQLILPEQGLNVLLSGSSAIWFMNIINLLYLALFSLIITESIRMHGWYAPVRIIVFTVLTVMMSAVTLATLSLIIIVSILYVLFKILMFFFSGKRKKGVPDDKNESLRGTLSNGFRAFRAELYAWESERKTVPVVTEKKDPRPVIKRSKPKIVRKPKPRADDIPRFHPD